MGGAELFLGGIAAFAVLSVVVRVWAGVRRAQAAAQIAGVGTSPVSVVGRVLVTALVIVGVQWLVIAHVDDREWWWVALGVPALVTAATVTRALTVVQINPSSRRGGRR